MAEPGPWLHPSASCHRTNCSDALLGEGKDSQGTCVIRSSLNEQSRIRAGLLCHSEGPGSGVLPQGKAVFCVVFLSCFLAMGMKAPMDWICKALRTTPGPEGRVTVGERSNSPSPGSGKGGNRRLCLTVVPLRLQLQTANGIALFITPEGVPRS